MSLTKNQGHLLRNYQLLMKRHYKKSEAKQLIKAWTPGHGQTSRRGQKLRGSLNLQQDSLDTLPFLH